MEGHQSVLEDPEVAAAAVVAVTQEDRCGRGLEDLGVVLRQVEGLERQLRLDPRVVAVDLGLVGGLAGSHQDHQDLPVGWAAPGIAHGAGSAEPALPAAVEDPFLGGLAVEEVPGSYELGAVGTGAVRAVPALPSWGSPSAVGLVHASWPASGHGAASLAEHISAAAEGAQSGEAELGRTDAGHPG